MNKSIKYLNNYINDSIDACIILGSGLNSFIDVITNKIIIDYESIPEFLKTKVEGHKGQLIIGKIHNSNIICASGRFHYYEGHSFDKIGNIIEIFNYYNPKVCIITNSSGCLDYKWKLGSLMLANQFIDYSFIDSSSTQFYDYQTKKYFTQLLNIAKINNITINQGAYTFTTGPVYETASEIQDIINIGGKAVGMSTFPEFLKCQELKIESLVISCLTNYGAGILKDEKIKHEDVLNNAIKYKNDFNKLLIEFIKSL